jgi:MFS family permease
MFLRDPPREGIDPGALLGSVPLVRLGEAMSSLFSSGAFILALVYWGVLGIAGWMVVGWVPTYLQENFHLAQGAAGLLATIYLNVASLLGLLIGGVWADRWSMSHPRACIFVSAIGQIAAVPGILLLCFTGSLPLAIIGLAFYGLTNSFSSSEMMPILCLISDPRYRATGYGILNLFACEIGGATIYAGGALRDAHVDVNKLFEFGAVSLLLCGLLLFLIKPRPGIPALAKVTD